MSQTKSETSLSLHTSEIDKLHAGLDNVGIQRRRDNKRKRRVSNRESVNLANHSCWKHKPTQFFPRHHYWMSPVEEWKLLGYSDSLTEARRHNVRLHWCKKDQRHLFWSLLCALLVIFTSLLHFNVITRLGWCIQKMSKNKRQKSGLSLSIDLQLQATLLRNGQI